jgi:hypothetical protein
MKGAGCKKSVSDDVRAKTAELCGNKGKRWGWEIIDGIQGRFC